MQTETSTTKSRAHRTAIPAFAPVLRPPTGGSGIEVDEGLDIILVGVKDARSALGVVESRLSPCTVGAGFVDDEAGRIRGVSTRVVVMSVELLAIRHSACLRYDGERQTRQCMWRRERERERENDSEKSNTAYGPDAGDDPRGYPQVPSDRMPGSKLR